MLWYGFIYYIFSGIFATLLLYFLLRLVTNGVKFKYNVNSVMSNGIVSLFCYFFLTALLILYYLLDHYSTFSTISVLGTHDTVHAEYLVNLGSTYWFNTSALGLNYVSIYYFPFIYIFLIVTFLSIAFCLSYNTNEVFSFMFYCSVITVAGYVLFFTDSIILFFLAYEMLLVPSFFILYNFAKTRRCVEAAYLMFF